MHISGKTPPVEKGNSSKYPVISVSATGKYCLKKGRD